jgi:hypothetical protein
MIEFASNSSKSMSLLDAVLYCQFLEINGNRGWRLPTINELISSRSPVISKWAFWSSNDLNNMDGWGDHKCYVIPVRDVE